jgi:PKD repeat protein
MRKLLLGLLLLATVFIGACNNNDEIPALLAGKTDIDYPIADFEYTISPTDPQKVTFKSTSSKYATLYWQLGDDSLSTAEELVHQYQTYGKFRVILTARNEEGYSTKKEVSIFLKNPEFNPLVVGENYVLTKGGELSVLNENGGGPTGGEGSLKLVDGNIYSKFFVGFNQATGTWWQFRFIEPVLVQAYTITSGDDAPDRDPVDWTLEASNDGTTWQVLSNIVGFKWPINSSTKAAARNSTAIFHITSNDVAYSYYRINITKTNGAGALQVSEWTLNASQP